MHFNILPSQALLLKTFSYAPETGIITRIWGPTKRSDRYLNKAAGNIKADGYIYIGINKTLYLAHRIIWKMVYGCDPLDQIDHINRKRADNRIVNLRQATNTENQKNTLL
nr:HNH endonuclease [Rhodospirillales bacterium]